MFVARSDYAKVEINFDFGRLGISNLQEWVVGNREMSIRPHYCEN